MQMAILLRENFQKKTSLGEIKVISNPITIFLLLFILIACNESRFRDYYENGNLKSEVLLDSNGNWDGIFRGYFEDGSLKTKIQYESGLENGLYIEYSQKGFVAVRGEMKDGVFIKSEGLDSLGNVFERRLYKNGSISYVAKFDKKGKKIDSFLLPVLVYERDTVQIGNEHCLEIKLEAELRNDPILTIGYKHDGEFKDIDTLLFQEKSLKYCIKTSDIGKMEVVGFFEYKQDKKDTTSIDQISFEHDFFVEGSLSLSMK